jgi:hypothetical protein
VPASKSASAAGSGGSAPSTALFSRAGSTAAAIARDLLTRSPGDRIPSVADYAGRFNVGINTVQRAVAILQSERAAGVQPRGRLGTFLVTLDRARLWRVAIGEPLVGFMPLPYSRRYEGLATGLREALEAAEIPFSVAFMSGSRPRVEAIRGRNAFAVVSALAARELDKLVGPLAVALDLGPQTYVASHATIWRRGSRPARPRIGIDEDSVDQAVLTRAEFGDNADYVKRRYLQLVDGVRSGDLDAAVWNVDSVVVDESLEIEPLTTSAALRAEAIATAAALVVDPENQTVLKFLRDYLRPARIRTAQDDVLAARRSPAY